MHICVVFFFSSRRRHTRCLSDWSSDVCSSDLTPSSGNILTNGNIEAGTTGWAVFGVGTLTADTSIIHGGTQSLKRSEERRVGKECRSRWAPEAKKKNKNTEEDEQ